MQRFYQTIYIMNYLFFSFRHYGTNRAPMSLSFDTSWLLSNKGFTRELATWMRKILLDHSDVYFVTHLQVWKKPKNALKKATMRPKTLWSHTVFHHRMNTYLENICLDLNVTSKRFWPHCEKKSLHFRADFHMLVLNCCLSDALLLFT